MRDADARVVCRSYTQSRRHPTVVGVVAGWTLPVPVTIPQLVVGAVTCGLLWWGRGWWARLPAAWNVLAAAAVAVAAMWTVRHVRVGGRPPVWAAVGGLRYAAGRVAARLPARPRRLVWRCGPGARGG